LKTKRFNFAIIGGGLAATAMLTQLIAMVKTKAANKLLDPSRMTVQVFHKREVFGPGFPHSGRYACPFHITNMCASEMGIISGKPQDFQDWVSDNFNHLKERFRWFREWCSVADDETGGCRHYSRAIMGEYLKVRFQNAVLLGREIGLEIHLYPRSEVIDLRKNKDTLLLRISDLDSQTVFSKKADRVLLATGHWNEKNDRDGYFTSPWPAKKLLDNIPKGEKVAILGTSLSAIETLLTLSSEGEFVRDRTGELVYKPPENSRTFVLYSRRGLLPRVRGKMGKRKNKFMNRKKIAQVLADNGENLTLDAIFKLLNLELEDAYGHTINWEEIINPSNKPANLLQRYLDEAINGDGPNGELIWQTVLHQTFDVVRELYLLLTFEERKRFDRNYSSAFFTHAAIQPSVNAEKLLALMKIGLVEVVKLGKHYRLIKNQDPVGYELIYKDAEGIEKKDVYRTVVDARGQKKSLASDPSDLAKNLRLSGTVQTTEIRPVGKKDCSNSKTAARSQSTAQVYETGSIWIDPDSHKIMQMESDQTITPSNAIYAVGAMTRGQIIDASMARSIVQSTARIANDIVGYLTRGS
jgi:uncharacterized NAD(P)/FAD-binding protein YdhS